jgi:hypothetical protein
MRLGREKQNAISKYPVGGPNPEPPTAVNVDENSLTVPSFDTVKAHYAVVAVSI